MSVLHVIIYDIDSVWEFFVNLKEEIPNLNSIKTSSRTGMGSLVWQASDVQTEVPKINID